MAMKAEIIKTAKDSGLHYTGFLEARSFMEIRSDLKKTPPFVSATAEERINPFKLSDNAKTIIVTAASYYTNTTGSISMYARGLDYHKVMKRLSAPIVKLLEDNGYFAYFFCDSAPLNERFLASEAGIGFIGKNGFLITPKHGSFVFLSHIITDCDIEPDKKNTSSCYNCGLCTQACPSGALKNKDFYSCLSYITQKKGELSDEEVRLIKENNTCWGCDICQLVCPHNKLIPETDIPEFSENLICNITSLPESSRGFKKIYRDRAFSWCGKNVLERNLNIINKR